MRPDSGQKGLEILFREFSASKSDDQCLAGCAGGAFIELLCVSTLNAVLCLECNILDCYLDSNLDCHPDHCLFLTISGRARTNPNLV